MATIDQQFVEYIVKTLVNNPDKVEVDRKIDEKGVLLSLTVDPDDVGRVIGKRGVTAQSIRMLLRALGTKQDARYNLKIVNTDEGEGESEAHHHEKSTKRLMKLRLKRLMMTKTRILKRNRNLPNSLKRLVPSSPTLTI